jgi:RNA polymerase sigma-70 factor (ECF subfamily)
VTGEHAEPKDDSIESLMERYVAGDSRAFEALYVQVSPRLFGYLLRLCRDRQNAEDLVQVTFSKMHKARDSYIGGAPLLPWLMAIARRSFFDLVRHKKVRPEYLSSDGALPEPEQREVGLNSDMADALDGALSRLPPAYAEAIQLTKITGLSLHEAAEVLGTSNTAVKLRVHRGYKLLRKDLERFGRGSLGEEFNQ